MSFIVEFTPKRLHGNLHTCRAAERTTSHPAPLTLAHHFPQAFWVVAAGQHKAQPRGMVCHVAPDSAAIVNFYDFIGCLCAARQTDRRADGQPGGQSQALPTPRAFLQQLACKARWPCRRDSTVPSLPALERRKVCNALVKTINLATLTSPWGIEAHTDTHTASAGANESEICLRDGTLHGLRYLMCK